MKSSGLKSKALAFGFATFIAVAIFTVAGGIVFAADLPDNTVSIDREGRVNATRVVVIQIAGTNIFAQSRFGEAYIRWVLTTKPTTKISKRYGEGMTVTEIREGDILNFNGTLDASSSSLLVQTSMITDWSRTDGSGVFSGNVTGASPGDGSFTLQTKDKAVKVTASSTISVIKGKFHLSFSEIKVGDRILAASGVYNYTTNNLVATLIELYQDNSIFTPRNFQGTLKSVNLDSKSLGMTIEGKDYTVTLSSNTPVVNALRAQVSLQRFVIGDTVRVYGSIQDDNLSVIKAELVRNVSL